MATLITPAYLFKEDEEKIMYNRFFGFVLFLDHNWLLLPSVTLHNVKPTKCQTRMVKKMGLETRHS